MTQKIKITLSFLSVFIPFLAGAGAKASGQIPLNFPPIDMKTFAACEATINEKVKENSTKPKETAEQKREDGSSLIQGFVSAPPKTTAPEVLEYKFEEYTLVKSLSESKEYIVTNYSYRRTTMSCNGAILNTNQTMGYTLPSYEKVN